MEIHNKLDELTALVESARTMPMSSSAILNKSEVLKLVAQVREMLPESLEAADAVIRQREELLEEARANAAKIINDAKIEQATLVGDHTILVEARRERGRTLEQTRQEIEAMKVALDDHIDAKLARVELVAERIVETVREGRDELQRTSPYDELAVVTAPVPSNRAESSDERDPSGRALDAGPEPVGDAATYDPRDVLGDDRGAALGDVATDLGYVDHDRGRHVGSKVGDDVGSDVGPDLDNEPSHQLSGDRGGEPDTRLDEQPDAGMADGPGDDGRS